MDAADLWTALQRRLDQLSEVAQAAAEHDPDEEVAWTGLVRGSAALEPGAGPVEGRLRVAGTDDVLVRADRAGTRIELVPAQGPATLETDAAARTLMLWGRRTADPGRWRSDVGPEELRRVRSLLAGY
ncbi:MAG TPA: hypothetical protein VHU88_12690 [Sporichthyaceae bacterium]|jgi:hypothetical protein|nr:hypothetical protein [Sporichthyaceae bacterium]